MNEPHASPSPPPASSAALAKRGWPAGIMVSLAFFAMIPVLGVGAGPLLLAYVFRTIVDNGRGGKHRLAWCVGLVVGLVIFVAPWMVLGPMEPIGPSTDVAREIACASHLRAVSRGIELYVEEHGEAPESLQALVSADLIRWEQLSCPWTEHAPPTIDYFYYPPAWGAEGVRLLGCDLHTHPRRRGRYIRRTVLFSDGSTPLLSEDDFAAELAKPVNAGFAAALEAQQKARLDGKTE